MFGSELSASRPAVPEPPIRIRVPASRGGLAWLAVLILVGGFLTVQLGRQVYASWAIGQERDGLQAEITALEGQNAALQRELDYLQSDAYVSAEARRLLNLGRPGERLLIIPPGAEAAPPAEETSAQPPPPPLLDQWLELFFGR